jgi:hypothetical protein
MKDGTEYYFRFHAVLPPVVPGPIRSIYSFNILLGVPFKSKVVLIVHTP